MKFFDKVFGFFGNIFNREVTLKPEPSRKQIEKKCPEEKLRPLLIKELVRLKANGTYKTGLVYGLYDVTLEARDCNNKLVAAVGWCKSTEKFYNLFVIPIHEA